MVVIILGMSKSGTTLVSKTLHESGINMHPPTLGLYPKNTYEDLQAVKILKKMIGVDKLKSLYLPGEIIVNRKIIKEIKKLIASRKGDWGIKQPYMTLCYHIWKKYLPKNHKVVAIKRTPEGLISHWTKRKKKIDKEKLLYTQKHYNDIIDKLNVPVISFEDFLKNGPKKLSKIIGRKLKDVRR